jgi:hypothetical protein
MVDFRILRSIPVREFTSTTGKKADLGTPGVVLESQQAGSCHENYQDIDQVSDVFRPEL